MNSILESRVLKSSLSGLFKLGLTFYTSCFLVQPLQASGLFPSDLIKNLRQNLLEQIIESDDDETVYFDTSEFSESDDSDEFDSLPEIEPSDLQNNRKTAHQSPRFKSLKSVPKYKNKAPKLKHPPERLSGLSYDWQRVADEVEQSLYPHKFIKGKNNRFQLGLENFGNTCFFNGAMKLLASDEQFTKAISGKVRLERGDEKRGLSQALKENRSERLKTSNRLKNHILTLINLVRQSESSNDKQRHYKKISQQIKKVFRDYRSLYLLTNNRKPEDLPGIQQDPEEFLQTLFDFIGYKDHSGFTLADTIKWDNEDSVRISSTTKNNILNLSIKPFGSPAMSSVQEALDNFLQTERVNGSESNAYVDGEKQFKFIKAPQSLIIQLKRYELDYMTMQTKRVSNPVKVDAIEVPIYDEEGKEKSTAIYSPVAVEVHASLGGNSLNFGHYYTYVKEGEYWIEHNDSRPPFIKYDAEGDISRNAYLIKYNLKSLR